MTVSPPTALPRRLADLWPGIVAASSFAICNVLSKVVMADGADVLTVSLFRGLVGVALMFAWLQIVVAPTPLTPRERTIALGLGVLFAGVVFGLFAAIAIVPVPIAVLTYFVYPLLTGIGGALLGIDRLGWHGALTALVAFLGLAVMIGAHPQGIALAGLAFALGAAACRAVILLVTRARLQNADSRTATWYLMLSSTAVFVLAALATWNWQGPQTGTGWASLIILSVGTTIAVFAMFVSTNRIGPFRTALVMFLEPLLSTVLSAPILGEVITPVQAVGGLVMLAALAAFHFRR